MTMARFPRGEHTADGGRPPWIEFIREVNGIRPGTFVDSEMQEHTPRRGYTTEAYPAGARVIHGPHRDEGVRVMADNDAVAAAFYVAGARLKAHIPNAEGVPIVIGLTQSDRDRDYVSFDGYRPEAKQELHLITVGNLLLEHAEGWTVRDWAEAVFEGMNSPAANMAPIQDYIRRERLRLATRSLSVGDTVTVLDQTLACVSAGWLPVSPMHTAKCAECGRAAYFLGQLEIAHHFEDEQNADHQAVINPPTGWEEH